MENKAHHITKVFTFIKKRESIFVSVSLLIIILFSFCAGWKMGKNSNDNELISKDETTESQEEENTALKLQKDAYESVNEIIENYYIAKASGDINTITAIIDNFPENEEMWTRELSRYIEYIKVSSCYTLPGLTKDSFIVYPYLETKFYNIDSILPGTCSLYICKNSNGDYYIHDYSTDSKVSDYITQISQNSEVQYFFNEVIVHYNDLLADNEELNAFMAELPNSVSEAIGEGIMASNQTENSDNKQVVSQKESGVNVSSSVQDNYYVKAIDIVNIRKSDSEMSDILGKAAIGDEFLLVEQQPNGWTKVIYNDMEAYLKSEYLTEAGSEKYAANEGTEKEAVSESIIDESMKVPNSGEYRVKDTINVRISANENAGKLGVCYVGDVIEIIKKQADGWTKVKFNGKTGYIKSDVLK